MALTTRDRVKDYLDKSSLTTIEQTVLDVLIEAISDYIEDYTDRVYQKADYVEVYDGPASNLIVLKHYPVFESETFSIEARETLENKDDWNTIGTDQYFVDYDSGIIKDAHRSNFILAENRYRVTYTAGYDFNLTDTFLSDVGLGDLELACWMLTKNAFLRRTGRTDISSEKIGDYSISFGENVNDFTFGKEFMGSGMIKSILDKYKRFEPASTLTPRNSNLTDEEKFELNL
jgi:hypothetical protein